MTGEEAKRRPVVGEMISWERDGVERIGKIVGWYDQFGRRTFVAEVEGELSANSSDGRWHVSELAATPAEASRHD